LIVVVSLITSPVKDGNRGELEAGVLPSVVYRSWAKSVVVLAFTVKVPRKVVPLLGDITGVATLPPIV
jgi:hypothetical protein